MHRRMKKTRSGLLFGFVSLVLAALVTVAQAQGTVNVLEQDCLTDAQRVANICANVLESNDPFELLNCCTEAQKVNEQRCFCQGDVALGLGSAYDLTMEVLQSGYEILSLSLCLFCLTTRPNSKTFAL